MYMEAWGVRGIIAFVSMSSSVRRYSFAVMIWPLAAGLISLIAVINLCEMRPVDLGRLVEYEAIQGTLWGVTYAWDALGSVGRSKIMLAVVVMAMLLPWFVYLVIIVL